MATDEEEEEEEAFCCRLETAGTPTTAATGRDSLKVVALEESSKLRVLKSSWRWSGARVGDGGRE